MRWLLVLLLSNERNISIDNIAKLAAAFGIAPSKLLEDEPE